MNSRNALDAQQMRAQLVVSVVVPAFAHQIEVVVAQQIREGIGIINLKRLARVLPANDLVTARSVFARLLGRQPRLEEAFRAQLQRVRQLCRSDCVLFNCYVLVCNTRLRRPRQKEPDSPSLRNRMRHQQRKWIGEVTADKRVDLAVDTAADWPLLAALVLRRQPLGRVRLLLPDPRFPLQAASSVSGAQDSLPPAPLNRF